MQKVKKIEVRVGNDSWTETDEVYGGRNNDYDYRIKTEPKYRPFKNKKECWEEMLKHQPFGWVKDVSRMCNIITIREEGIIVNTNAHSSWYDLENSIHLKFVDGTPFGIKE